MTARVASTPISRAVWLALASAVAFGATTPALKVLAHTADPAPVAALLYGGASAAALAMTAVTGASRSARVSAQWWPRLAAVALFGAVLAPMALAAGLSRCQALTASLLLNLEAVFTVALGALVWREPVGRTVLAASAAITAGGALVAADGGASSGANVLSTTTWVGPLAIVGATLGWALDNTLSRPLADLDPARVVAAKGGAGAAASTGLALATGASWPDPAHAVGIVVCGAIGFGASLGLYLRAQRVLGSARTGSVFAVAPFLGALGAWLVLGEAPGGWLTAVGAAAMAGGVWLHLGEDHDHPHEHEPITHDHEHTHDDDHHDDHVHDPPVVGAHSHVHTHAARTHAHPHGEDLHHRHHGADA